ncbi:hypothetical protein EJ110_NYTH54387 [Nymphaea thermarum]|nr:hypothetical protein EJ110_NYTH54387 [Nymphaea thermarum]
MPRPIPFGSQRFRFKRNVGGPFGTFPKEDVVIREGDTTLERVYFCVGGVSYCMAEGRNHHATPDFPRFNAMRIRNRNQRPTAPPQLPSITLFTYGGPRVGNMKFKERCEKLGVKVLRSVNIHDMVPQVPGVVMNEKNVVAKVVDELLRRSMAYTHVGLQLSLDHAWSSFLKQTNDVSCYHNLEMYLHLVDGYHGKNMKFESATQRDVALVNKSCDFLSEELGLPPNWKQYENKGLVRSADGRLVLPATAPTDGHPPDTHVSLSSILPLPLPFATLPSHRAHLVHTIEPTEPSSYQQRLGRPTGIRGRRFPFPNTPSY